jgi:hypothetical protein
MAFNSLYKSAEKLIVDNSSAILTGVAVAGTVATAVLTGRAAFKSAETISEKNDANFIEHDEFLTTKEKVMLVWPQFIPSVGMGAMTIGSIIFANRISSKRVAALAAAYSLSEKSFGEYKEKTLQHLGIKKEEALRDEIAQDRVNLHPIEQTIIIGDGDHICYDAITGRYFKSNMETIRQAENKVNYEIIHYQAASLSSFYEEIGLPPTSYSDDVGWNIDNLIEVAYTSTLTSEGKPCIHIDFKVAPITGYGKHVYS